MTDDNPRAIDLTDIADGDLIRYDATAEEFVKLTPPTEVSLSLTVPADLTGGESPTEAEHNAALTAIRDLHELVQDLQAALVAGGLMTAD